MTDASGQDIARPLSRYSPFRRAGNLVYFSGIVAADAASGRVIRGYDDVPEEVRAAIGATGEMSSDAKDGPIAAQSWFVLDNLRKTVAAAGG